eukprot:m.68742 g.68742  ORF g.68742 m.68742 type:complete len:558 (+) comp13925_c0_seq1:220-1893(+)
MSRPSSHMSSRSKASTAASRRQYRTVSATSHVDDLLFGGSQRSAPRSTRQQGDSGLSDFFSGGGTTRHAPSPRRSRQAPQETYEIVTKDGVRKIKVPQKESQTESCVVLSQADYDRICRSAVVKTKEQLRKEREQAKASKLDRAEQASRRRAEMQQVEARQRKAQPISDLELEEQQKRERITEGATRLREEEEDEIKRLNEMILQAKVYAIRDAQMQEKVQLHEQDRDYELRLDQMMEEERIKGLQQQEEADMDVKRKRIADATELRKQIQEREMQALLAEELKEQETQAMIRQLEEMKVEDEKVLAEKREKARVVMEDASRYNDEARRLRQQLVEAEKEEDKRVAEYLKEKAAKEAELEAEKKREALAREKELARLRAMQESVGDKIAERQALEAKRAQDDRERQLRKEEREKERKRQEILADLQQSREEQLRAKEAVLAYQSRLEREDFERVLQAQQELIAQEEEKKLADHSKRRDFQKEIRSQIVEKESERVGHRKEFFEEGRRLDQEAQARRKKLDEIKQRKLAELQAAGVDDKYLGPIKRLIAAPATTKFST